MNCPHCDSKQIFRLKTQPGWLCCVLCRGKFPAPKQSKGSGVIAGRITIPQYHFGWSIR